MDKEEIREAIKTWLKKRKLNFSQYERGCIQCQFRGKETGFNLIFGNISSHGFTVIGSTGKLIPEEHRQAAYEYACRINFSRLATVLEIDPTDGEWRDRVHLPLMGRDEVLHDQLDWAERVVRSELLKHVLPFEQGKFDEDDTDDDDDWEIQDEDLRRILDGGE